MAYSLELRIKAIEAYASGEGTQEEIANYFQISISTFKRWLQRNVAGDPLAPIIEGKGRPKTLDNRHLEMIQRLVKENPSITLGELSEKINKKYQINAGRSVLGRALQGLNLRYKKLSLRTIEKDAPEVKKKRTVFIRVK